MSYLDKDCPHCGSGKLEPSRGAGKGPYRDYPNLLSCPACGRRFDPIDGELVYVEVFRIADAD